TSGSGGSGANYFLPDGWIVGVVALSATNADFSFTLTGVGFITTVNLDNSGGATSTLVVDMITGSSCEVWVGTSGIDSIFISGSTDVALAFGLGGDDHIELFSSSLKTHCVIFGGGGTDRIYGGAYSDFLYGDWLPGFGFV